MASSSSSSSAKKTTSFSIKDDDWATMLDFFHNNGYIVIGDGLPAPTVADLHRDVLALDAAAALDDAFARLNSNRKKSRDKTIRHHMTKRFFEKSRAMVALVAQSQSGDVVDFVQHIIEDVPGSRGNALRAHLIHNNAFVVPPGGRGQAPVWHVDDALQNIILPPGTTLPDEVKLPVLAVTCMCWLSDCSSPANGPTFVVPGSHRSGRGVDPALADQFGVPACGPPGTVVIVNSQIWHRGCANTSTVPRVCMQMSFGRRMIGHKFGSIMNYHMPAHVVRDLSAATTTDKDAARERFGFLEGGAYS